MPAETLAWIIHSLLGIFHCFGEMARAAILSTPDASMDVLQMSNEDIIGDEKKSRCGRSNQAIPGRSLPRMIYIISIKWESSRSKAILLDT